VASLALSGAAAAQNAERGVAQSLFEEGVRLMRAKDYAAACPKLAESHRLEPAGGTILNLAVCLEQDGKLASSYVAYDEALARARRDNNKQRIQVAEQHMAALRPKLSRVTITVAAADPKPEVKFDGTAIGEQAWGVAFYADVGTHTITAEAPGRRPFHGELRVEAAGKSYDTSVPLLDVEPAPPPPPPVASVEPKPAPPSPPPVASVDAAPRAERGPLPWILVGTGAVLIGAGAVTGVLAIGKHGDSNDACPAGRCTAAGVDAENQANTFAWISDVTIPLGVVAAGVGTYLFLRDPKPRAAAHVQISPTTSGVVVHGAF
jgi:hypothetical protein